MFSRQTGKSRSSTKSNRTDDGQTGSLAALQDALAKIQDLEGRLEEAIARVAELEATAEPSPDHKGKSGGRDGMEEGHACQKCVEKDRLLAQKDGELASLKALQHSTHDNHSADEIYRQLDQINNSIDDLAADGAYDWLPKSTSPPDPPSTGGLSEKDMTHLEDVLGKPFVRALQETSVKDSDAEILLRIAFEALVTDAVVLGLDPFACVAPYFPKDLFPGDILAQVGDSVKQLETQADYAHWRSLTYKQVRKTVEEQDLRGRADRIAGWTCTWCFHAIYLLGGHQPHDWDTFQTTFKSRMADIMVETFKLASMLQEGVKSVNYYPFRPRALDRVDKASMDVEESEEIESGADDVVVCSTLIGLRHSKKSDALGTEVSGIAKKARVLTQQVLDELSTAH